MTPLTAADLYPKVSHAVPAVEWATMADDVDAIMRLKQERNAVILAHNYMTPEIFHGVSDIVGDSLALAREAIDVRRTSSCSPASTSWPRRRSSSTRARRY